MSIPLYQVDAFTAAPFAGNPAAVCVLDDGEQSSHRDAAWMQRVAQEMNLSETAFLQREADGYGLRWFTPATEVKLCGHATLASAHTLWENGYLAPGETARFHTQSGLLTADKTGEWIEMNFPARHVEPTPAPEGLAEALGVTLDEVVAGPGGPGGHSYLALVADEQSVRQLRPDFVQLQRLPVRAVIVTAPASTPGFDFVSRFFAPALGINEDPVTGSAHCYLGPFWQAKRGKSAFTAFQASARGGIVRVRVDGERVYLGGQAVTVFRGELLA